MTNKQTATDKIASLVTRFEEQYQSYKHSDYNETLTRRDFIDPFFKALGWDIDNEAGYAEAYREVIHEDKVKVSGATKAPDYSFRLVGGKRLFFVEAKKPSVSVKDDIQPAYQVRRYGWSAKLPISIITDFEEFSVYDCTKKPKPNDKPAVARIKYLSFRDYIKEFDFLWDTFSKEQVLKGSFDKFLLSDTHKKGTATVDKDFLESLDRWRTYLAVNISWNNRTLDEDEINFVVQQTIDRIIFLRIAEDRSVEPYGTLKHAVKQGNLYQNLFELFQRADEKYNSGLFDFKKDKISQNIVIENKIIRTIINELYYPECPYEFSVLSVEILGSAYEQFLGKVIRITPAHHAKIEEKPEVRKAGGVYYTPQYIVDYIVKNTVGKLIEGKTPKEISKIKILDPACGSGSFLIGAFQYLLDYHKDYYSENGKPSKGKKDNPLTPDGHLTTAEKKRILLNNIFGVDLDVNAVEVTKLSLLIKCLEGETEASIQQQLSMWNERVLPTLDGNIKNGNSIVDNDFYESKIDFNEEKRIKPFSWQKEFSPVFLEGGFDVIIGNPPYIRLQGLQESQPAVVNYVKSKFKAARSGNFDLYVLFDELGLNLLKNNGLMGFIQPHKFIQANFGKGIRDYISTTGSLKEIVHFGSEQVFNEVTTYTCLLFLQKGWNKKVEIKQVNNLYEFSHNFKISKTFTVSPPKVSDKWNLFSESDNEIFLKLNKNRKLGDVTKKIFVGLQTSSDRIYVLEKIKEKENTVICFSKSLESEIEIEKGLIKPFLLGKDIKRFSPLVPKHFVVFPYHIEEHSPKLMSQEYILRHFPKGWDYILMNRKGLENREKGKMKGENFYAYIYPKNLSSFEYLKICTPDIASIPNFTIDRSKSYYHTTTVYSLIFNQDIKEDYYYLIGILNSRIMWYFLKETGNVLRGNFFRFKTEYLKPFPIKLIDFKNKSEVKIYNDLIQDVKDLFFLNSELSNYNLENQKNQIMNKINFVEKKVNQNIYTLYNLTEKEIEIVEKP